MDRRGTPALLLPLLAMLAAAYPLALNVRLPTAPTPQEKPRPRRASQLGRETPTSKETKATRKPPEAQGAGKIVSDFLGDPPAPDSSFPIHDFRSRYTIDFMIVTVPDPIDSRLPYLFDRFLGSIQRAVEADHYVLDRFDLPWLEEIRKKESAKESVQELVERPVHHPFRKEPGFILFRNPQFESKDTPQPRLLLVFLVGETPTTGIHKLALREALNQIGWFCGIGPAPGWGEAAGPWANPRPRYFPKPFPGNECGPIKILGPSFSGSAESLDFGIQAWLESREKREKIRFKIISGSATAIPVAPDPSPDSRHYFVIHRDDTRPTFGATVVRDEVLLDKLLEYLQSLQARKTPLRIALLSEGNTAYGASVRKEVPGRKDKADKPVSSPEITNLPFPPHISRLRSESEKARRTQDQTAQPVASAPSRYLALPVEDETGEATDAIPPFSQLDVSSSELVLANLLSTVSREQFPYVGIAATDVRDTIFLAREIREHSPSTVIFSLNADLLYAHPEANPNTRGMLVVTPYPLFALNQLWTYPYGKGVSRLQFPDQSSEGVYNAMLALLGHEKEMLDYDWPLRDAPNAEKTRMPPVWIATVGRGGLWPVAVRPWTLKYTYTLPASSGPDDTDRRQNTFPRATIVLMGFWSALCLVPAFFFLIRHMLPRRIRSKGTGYGRVVRRAWLLWEPVFKQNRLGCRAYFLAGGIAGLTPYLVASSAFYVASVESWKRSPWRFFLSCVILVLIITLAACFALALAIIGRLTREALEKRAKRQFKSFVLDKTVWLAALILIGGVVIPGLAFCSAWRWVSLRHQDFANGVLVGMRAINLSSGVSPLLPLFFIAFAATLWAQCSVQRLRLSEALVGNRLPPSACPDSSSKRDSTAYFFNEGSMSFGGLHYLEEKIQEQLERPAFGLPGFFSVIAFAVAIIALLWCAYLSFFRAIYSLEVHSLYWLLGASFLFVDAAIVLDILRLVFLWSALRNVLRRLDRHPMRGAFERFHQSHPSMPPINLTAAPNPLTALRFSIDEARRFLGSSKNLAADANSHKALGTQMSQVEEWVRKAEHHYSAALEAEAHGRGIGSLVRQIKAQRAMARVSRIVEKLLEPDWQLSASDRPTAGGWPRTLQPIVADGEEFLVSRTVHFLSHVFPQLTNLAYYSLASLLLMLTAVSSYPLQPRIPLTVFNWVVILSFVAAAVVMFVQMNRDAILSNLKGTKPGELNWDREFIFRMAFYGLIPILALLGVQFPEAVGQILSWLTPAGSGHP